MRKIFGTSTLELLQGDITQQNVDAIVNAANAALAGGGGVDGAIHRAGGPSIMEECRRIGGCPTGQTVMTGGGRLPARHVLHTVGPVWRGGTAGEPELLASCYRTAMTLARENSFKSVAFASISTGVYGYPLPDASRVALATLSACMREGALPELVRMVLFNETILDVYQEALTALSEDC